MPLHGVFRAALNGVHERGDGGLVYVDGDRCAYLFPRELEGHPEAQESLTDMLADEKAKLVFYVLEKRQDALHVLAYPRERVLADMSADAPSAIEETAPETTEEGA